MKKSIAALIDVTESILLLCFRGVPPMIDDCMLTECTICHNKAWLKTDIKHKTNCQVGQALKAIDKIRKEEVKSCLAAHQAIQSRRK